MVPSVVEILQELGPCLSSKVVARLVLAGLPAEAARKRVSRAGKPVCRIRGVRFKNKEYFLYLDGHFYVDELRDRLREAFLETNSAYGRAITGLSVRDGQMLGVRFPIASGLPTQLAKGHILHSDVEKVLIDLEMIVRVQTPDGEMFALYDAHVLSNRRRSTMIVEEVLLSAIRAWLVKLGWSSTNTLKVRSSTALPVIGQFAWDIVGPCYLAAMTKIADKKILNAFIAGDIVLGRTLSLKDLLPFLAKWEALKAQKRQHRIQPLLIADSLEMEALDELRGRGIMVCTPTAIFGEDLAKDIRQLVHVIENAAAAVVNGPYDAISIVNRVAKIEGAALNLRGVVAEMLVAYLYKCKGFDIDIRQQIQGENNKVAEIDVKARKKSEIVCCECKGNSSNVLVDVAEIEDWLDRVVPRIKHWLNKSESVSKIQRFEFYCTSDYTDAAHAYIEKIKQGHKKQPIDFFTGMDILAQLQQANETALVNIFREQFPQGKQS